MDRAGIRSAHIPTSRAQSAELLRRRWLLERNGEPYVNNLSVAVRLEGTVDREALAKAVLALSARHEALRANFPKPWPPRHQVIQDEVSIPLRWMSLPPTRSSAVWQHAERRAAERVLRSPDPSADVLGTVDLFEIDPARSVIALTMDHLVADGLSMSILATELSDLYDAERKGQESGLPAALQYREFVAWESEQRRSGMGVAFWSRQLAGMGPLPRTALPGARVNTVGTDFRGATFTAIAPHGLAVATKAFAKRERVTPFAVWLASVIASIHATTGTQDVGVLVPVANRDLQRAGSAVGWLANTVVVRVAVPAGVRNHEVVAATWASLLDAVDHQATPWDDLVQAWIDENGDLEGIPPQVFVSGATDDHGPPLSLAGCRATEIEYSRDTVAHAFDMRFGFVDDDVRVRVRYPQDLYDDQAARQVVDGVFASCDGIVARPDALVT